MRRVFVAPDQLRGERVALTGEAHHHLARVLRARVGDGVVVFDGLGTEWSAEVVSIARQSTTLRLGERRVGATAAPAARITLLQALARGEKMDFIIQKTCELGVARVTPVFTLRTTPGPATPAAASARQQRWERIAREAARQSGRADVPIVDGLQPLEAALAAAPAGDRRYVFWESADAPPLRAVLATAPGHAAGTTLLVGPEGGFSSD
ncbi:MAG TPA: RsmE family RNA methyltransferase, partial [Polyangia bacterium]|nr:RsmE family RNA methyltransferase [Polyangia bacterium]